MKTVRIARALLTLLNLSAGLILMRFTVSKLAAWPISVAAFEDMAKPLGLDPTAFRISTGFIIGIASLSFFINCLIVILKKGDHRKRTRIFTINSLYSIGAMTGALLSEFFLRSDPKWMLVYIAIGIIGISLTNLASCYKNILNVNPHPSLP